jgi:hypothetical protein
LLDQVRGVPFGGALSLLVNRANAEVDDFRATNITVTNNDFIVATNEAIRAPCEP